LELRRNIVNTLLWMKRQGIRRVVLKQHRVGLDRWLRIATLTIRNGEEEVIKKQKTPLLCHWMYGRKSSFCFIDNP